MNLLEQWSKVTVSKVTEFVQDEAWDGYDFNNLQLSRKFIQDSISDELYERIK